MTKAEKERMREAFKLLKSNDRFKLVENICINDADWGGKDSSDSSDEERVSVLCRYAIFDTSTGQLIFGISMKKYEAERDEIEEIIQP